MNERTIVLLAAAFGAFAGWALIEVAGIGAVPAMALCDTGTTVPVSDAVYVAHVRACSERVAAKMGPIAYYCAGFGALVAGCMAKASFTAQRREARRAAR